MLVAERPDVSSEPVEGETLEVKLKIYIFPQDGRWRAEATDLALMTEGADPSEAFRCLLEQIVAYVRTVGSRGWLDQLHRPVTLRHRLELQARVALAKLRRKPAQVRTKLLHI